MALLSEGLMRKSEEIIIKNSDCLEDKQKCCYLYRVDDGFNILFIPQGRNTFEYYADTACSKRSDKYDINYYIEELEKDCLIEQTRRPYSVSFKALKDGQFDTKNMESTRHKGLFFAGAVCGSTNILQSIVDGNVAGKNVVNYLNCKK